MRSVCGPFWPSSFNFLCPLCPLLTLFESGHQFGHNKAADRHSSDCHLIAAHFLTNASVVADSRRLSATVLVSKIRNFRNCIISSVTRFTSRLVCQRNVKQVHWGVPSLFSPVHSVHKAFHYGISMKSVTNTEPPLQLGLIESLWYANTTNKATIGILHTTAHQHRHHRCQCLSAPYHSLFTPDLTNNYPQIYYRFDWIHIPNTKPFGDLWDKQLLSRITSTLNWNCLSQTLGTDMSVD